MTTRCERFQSLALAVVLAAGAGALWAMAFLLLFENIRGFIPVDRLLAPTVGSEDLFVLEDGTPVIGSYTSGRDPIYRTVDGRPIELANPQRAEMAWLSGPPCPEDPFRPSQWSGRIASFQRSGDSTIWYFLHDNKLDGRGYFVGYDNLTKLPIGYIGRNGFSPEVPASDDQFLVDGRKIPGNRAICHPGFESVGSNCWRSNADAPFLYLLADDGLIQIDLKQRNAKVIRKESDSVSIIATAKTTFLVHTADRIVSFDATGKEIQTFVLPLELRDTGFQWLQVSASTALIRAARNDVWQNCELFWIDTTGKIVRRERVDLQPPSKSFQKEAMAIVVAPSPGTIAAIIAVNGWVYGNYDLPKSMPYWVALRKGLADRWVTWPITGTISVVLACLCYRRPRRYGLPWTSVWTGFVLLFGLPAYFGYLAHRAWPARLPCPNCGRLAPRDRPACLACGKDFPAPALKGIEVFG